MSSIHIRGVAQDTLDALKRLARSHDRSLEEELRAILERAARMAPLEPGVPELKLVTVKVGGSSSWNREDIYGEDDR